MQRCRMYFRRRGVDRLLGKELASRLAARSCRRRKAVRLRGGLALEIRCRGIGQAGPWRSPLPSSGRAADGGVGYRSGAPKPHGAYEPPPGRLYAASTHFVAMERMRHERIDRASVIPFSCRRAPFCPVGDPRGIPRRSASHVGREVAKGDYLIAAPPSWSGGTRHCLKSPCLPRSRSPPEEEETRARGGHQRCLFFIVFPPGLDVFFTAGPPE
jgi:hypothetical protein